MKEYLTNAQMREADSKTIAMGESSEVLMTRAGCAIAEEVMKCCREKGRDTILVVCGTGNNGGDGYVCARVLHEAGYCVSVYAITGELSTDCKREQAKYQGDYATKIEATIIVDCIFGTGLNRSVQGEYAKIIQQINQSKAYVISADIPSGLNGDHGKVMNICVQANQTVAIAYRKLGLVLNDGVDVCGKISCKDIKIYWNGDCVKSLDEDEIAQFYPKRKQNSHKGIYGKAMIRAGLQYAGAAYLAVGTALQSGCGYVVFQKTDFTNFLIAKYPQVVCLDDMDLSCQSIAFGMGMGQSNIVKEELEWLLVHYEGKLLIDADGINVLSQIDEQILLRKKCQLLLTSHVKEFSKLCKKTVQEILENSIPLAKEYAAKWDATILLKGATTIITNGEEVFLNTFGNSALAKAGSGDMLSGLIVGCMARGLSTMEAAICASATIGRVAEMLSLDRSEYCIVADDIISHLHIFVNRLTKQ